ncbi:TetR/AcrR family transcriptional regulator [Antrihabitans sp. NCIMB 15449]|jgi:AcrR family transcriptional regulator|uniref:TetR/AcrR family transcriptional regulator n=1 Tax=Antrihabitans spumae TaxID=3373370 RepID=A0ABW7JGN2_9NOCA
MSTARKRLDPEQRREQLLTIGARLFAGRPYEDVWIEEVAELAGVSRGLMYHYFPTKRDFFAAIIRLSAEKLLASTEVDPELPIADQVAAGLDAYIDFVVDNPHNVMAVNRGALSGEKDIREIVEWELGVLQQRIVEAVGLQGHSKDVATIAVRGWLVFTRAVCVDWVESRAVTRDELRELCLRTLAGALGPSVPLDEPPH